AWHIYRLPDSGIAVWARIRMHSAPITDAKGTILRIASDCGI
ncbi:hypothetical protein A2U01_0109960, partial [Trifolium medium]|nr:hypothetical protein [Trifolium medium]